MHKRKRQVAIVFFFLAFILSFLAGFIFLKNRHLFNQWTTGVSNIWQKITAPKVNYSFKGALGKSGFALLNENKAFGFSVLLANSDNPKIPQARFEVDNAWIDFTIHPSIANNKGEAYKKVSLKTTPGVARKDSPGVKEPAKDFIIWENAIPSGDISYQIKPDGLKEEIILKDKNLAVAAVQNHELLTIPFNLTLNGVVPRRDLSGKLGGIFIDAKTGEYRFHLETPYMMDAKGARYEGLEYELVPVEVAMKSGFLRGSGRFLVEGNPEKKKDDHDQGKSNDHIGINSPEIGVIHDSKNSSILTVNNKQNIPSNISPVKNNKLGSDLASHLEKNISQEKTFVNHQKTASYEAASGDLTRRDMSPSNTVSLTDSKELVKRQRVVDLRGVEPLISSLTDSTPYPAGPRLPSSYHNYLNDFNSSQQKTSLAEGSLGLGDAKSPVPDKWTYSTTDFSLLSSTKEWRRVGDLHSSPAFAGPHYLSGTAPTLGVNPPPNSLYQKISSLINPAFAAEPSGVQGGSTSAEVEPQRIPTGSRYLLVLKLPREWLADPSRAYPVIIDPTITHNTQTAFATGTLNRVKDEGVSDGTPLLTSSYHELPADINTVGLWHMNEGISTPTADSSGNSNTGTLTNGPTWNTAVNSKLGTSSVVFDGINDYINIADNSTLDVTGQITLEAWIKVRTDITDIYQGIIDKGTGNGSNKVYHFGIDSNEKLRFYTANGVPVNNSTTSIAIGSWTHVAMTFDPSTDQVNFYINGLLDSTGTNTSAPYTSSACPVLIGAADDALSGACGALLSWAYFDGQIDEVRISNTARTPEEIKANAQRFPYSVYTSPVMDLTAATSWTNLTWLGKGVNTGGGETPISTTGLVAQWNFNSTSGTTATADAGTCGASCNGTLTNFLSTASQDQAAGTGWTSANRRWGAGALMFDGTDDFVDLGTNSSLFPTTGSYEIWFNLKSLPGASRQGVFGDRNTSTSRRIMVDDNAGAWCGGVPNQIEASMSTDAGGGTNYEVCSGSSAKKGQWYHVVITFGSGSFNLYVNGVLVKTTAYTGSLLISGLQAAIGKDGFVGSYSSVIVDSTRIYSRALTAAEILANYQAGNIEFQTRTSADNATWEAWKPTTSEATLDAVDSLSPVEKISQTSLTAYWKLDETSGTRADSKGANTLTDNATVTYAPGRLANAGQFTAANNEYLSIVDNASLSVADIDFTFSAWVYLDTKTTSAPAIVFKSDSSGLKQHEMFYTGTASTDRFRFGIYNGGYKQVDANSLGSPGTATWYFVVGWHDAAADTVNIQVNNGTVDSTATGNVPPLDDDGVFEIGRKNYDPTHAWNGRIDEVAFWKRTLTAAERTQLFEDGLDLHGAGSGRIYRSRDTTTKIEGAGSEKLQIGSPQVDANTVGLWHMEETSGTGAYIKDATANANHGTPTGTTVVDGFFGKARSFNGTSDYISLGNYQFSNTNTIEAWVKLNSLNGSPAIVSVSDATSNNQYNLFYEGGYIKWHAYTNGSNYKYYRASVTLNTGTWYHVASTHTSPTTTPNIYLNGVSLTVENYLSLGTPSHSSQPLFIGQRGDNGYYWNGSIDEVRISNTARTADEIAEAYRAGRDHRLSKTIASTDLSAKTKLPFYVAADRPGTYLEATVGESAYANYEADANTVGLWHLEEQLDASNSIKDSSGLGNNLTLTSAPPFVQGKIGKARNFDGTADYASCTDANCGGSAKLEPTGDYAIGAWIKTSQTSVAYIISKGADPANGLGNYELTINQAPNTAAFRNYTTANGNYVLAYNATVINDNNWHYIVGTISGTTGYLYIDGRLENSSAGSGTRQTNVTAAFEIGRRNDATGYYNGFIDEPFMSATSYTADQIRQAYEIGKRTHPITIDFKTSLAATNLITGSADLSFDLGCTIASLTNCSIAKGETIIVKENVGGTEYIGQGEISATSGSNVTVKQWDNGSTFPTGGYTTNATVFKWQREYFDLTGSLASQRDAITRLTMRVTDGSQGANVWLDDFRSNSSYLSDLTPDSFDTTTGVGTYSVAGASITSTLNRYFQYRAINSSWDTAVSPQLTSASLNWVSNSVPNAPTISAPLNGATGVALASAITVSATDPDSDYLRYKIQIARDAAFSVGLQTFDQTASQTGWSGQNAQANSAYTSGATATYTPLSALLTGKRYFIRAYTIDPGGMNLLSSVSSGSTFLAAGVAPGPCTSQPGGDHNIDESCSYTGASEGADGGNMIVRTGAVFTLNANQSIVWNPGQAITIQPGASIAINSSAKLTQNYMYTPSSGTSGYPDPIGFAGAAAVYHMDDALGNTETSGTTVFNSAGGSNGTATGTTITTGKYGNARSFNGTSDYISAGNLGTVQTVAFWVYPNSTSAQFIDLNGTAYISASAGTVSAAGFTSPTIYINGAAGNTITASAWQHIAVTTTTGINSSAAVFGKRGTSYFTGTLDEVQIFNRALSVMEITGLYNPPSSGIQFTYQGTNPDAGSYRRRKDITSAARSIGEWKLDEQSGTGAYLKNSLIL